MLQLYAFSDELPVARIYHGNSMQWSDANIDLVLTNPYASTPPCLHGKPMILTGKTERKWLIEELCGRALVEVSRWEKDESIWATPDIVPKGMPPIDPAVLSLAAEPPGWWPVDLPLHLLLHFGWDRRDDGPQHTVWDGFCGRGTAGMACRRLGLRYIGIDISEERCEMARRYLGLERAQ